MTNVIRQSNFESLRIFSILLITSMHILGVAFHTENVINKILILIVNTLGNTGVTLFILISGYWGIHFKLSKLIRLILIVWGYSVVSYSLGVYLGKEPFSFSQLFISIFPVLCKKYWFITCYVVIYCFSSYLNSLINTLSRAHYKRLLLIWGFFFLLAPTLLFEEIQNDSGKGLVNLVFTYFVGQYFQKYGFPISIKKHTYSILTISLLLIFICNSILSYLTGNIVLRFARDNNVLILLASCIIFYIVTQRKYYSQLINYLSGFVFPLYLLQGSIISWLHPWIVTHIQDDNFTLIFIGILFFICFVTVITEVIRRLLFTPIENKIVNFVEKKILLFYNRQRYIS